MKWILYIYFYFYCFPIKFSFKYNVNNYELKTNKLNILDKNEGYDNRTVNFKENNVKIDDIKNNLFKKKILNILLDNNVNINRKLDLIKKHNIIEMNKMNKINDIMKYFD